MNLFDGLQQRAQVVVTNTFGYTAIWQPAAGGDPLTAEVLLNTPTDKASIADQDYVASRPYMEYFEGDLPGLLESVLDKVYEVVTVNGISYECTWGEQKFDGKTIIIHLERKP